MQRQSWIAAPIKGACAHCSPPEAHLASVCPSAPPCDRSSSPRTTRMDVHSHSHLPRTHISIADTTSWSSKAGSSECRQSAPVKIGQDRQRGVCRDVSDGHDTRKNVPSLRWVLGCLRLLWFVVALVVVSLSCLFSFVGSQSSFVVVMQRLQHKRPTHKCPKSVKNTRIEHM